jgi:hypothetical protein
MQYCDLIASLKSYTTEDLSFALNVVRPKHISASIYGWAVSNLTSTLTGGYGPGDLHAYINVIRPVDLSASIRAFKGIEEISNLSAIVSGSYSSDLFSSVFAVPGVDLCAYIRGIGGFYDLSVSIVPKVVYVKTSINVSLLEHADLKAMINYSCFNSEYKDLSSYLYAIYKSDLRSYIKGWKHSFEIGNDLGGCVNAGVYSSEDKIVVRYVPETFKYTVLDLSFNVVDEYKVFDTIRLIYGAIPSIDLSASITGIFHTKDLVASITADFDYNYSELPQWIRPKSHEVVIDLKRFKERWKRFVEIMFDTQGGRDDLRYFFVEAENKVYRLDRDRHWVIWAKSYKENEDSIIERSDVRHKYIFRMSDYNSVDEAIRDLIDRVSAYREGNLSATIVAQERPYSDLNIGISPDVKYTWVKHLKASIIGVP